MYNILDYGAVSDGVTLSTRAIQSAVDECKANGGGVVYIPYGTYVLASITLCSNVHFMFEPGATLLGSLNPDDFNTRETIEYPLYQDASHSYFQRSMFIAEKCSNISFSGAGVIDMRSVWENTPVPGESAWTQMRANKIFAFKKCNNITISDLALLNSTDLAVYFAGCEKVRVTGLTLDVHIDGISPDCCKDVVISDCIIRSGDDGIVLKSSYSLNEKRLCENVVVTNCTISSRCCAIKLGTETNGGFRNIAVSNCAIHNTYLSGLALEITDGGEMDGVVISNIVMQNVCNPIFVILSDRRRGPDGTEMGMIKNIMIDNVIAGGPYVPWIAPQTTTLNQELLALPNVRTSIVTGQSSRKLENITLSNIHITVPGGGTEDDAAVVLPDNTKIYPGIEHFGDQFPVHGIYFRHIKNLTLCNVRVDTEGVDAREPFGFDDVASLNII